MLYHYTNTQIPKEGAVLGLASSRVAQFFYLAQERSTLALDMTCAKLHGQGCQHCSIFGMYFPMCSWICCPGPMRHGPPDDFAYPPPPGSKCSGSLYGALSHRYKVPHFTTTQIINMGNTDIQQSLYLYLPSQSSYI